MWQAVWKVVHLADPLVTAAMGRVAEESIPSVWEEASRRAMKALRALISQPQEERSLFVQVFILPSLRDWQNNSFNEQSTPPANPPTTPP